MLSDSFQNDSTDMKFVTIFKINNYNHGIRARVSVLIQARLSVYNNRVTEFHNTSQCFQLPRCSLKYEKENEIFEHQSY